MGFESSVREEGEVGEFWREISNVAKPVRAECEVGEGRGEQGKFV